MLKEFLGYQPLVTVRDKETRIDRAVYRPAYDVAVGVLPRIRDKQFLEEAQILRKARNAWRKLLENEGVLGWWLAGFWGERFK